MTDVTTLVVLAVLDEAATGVALDTTNVGDEAAGEDDTAATTRLEVEVDNIPVGASAAEARLTNAADSRLTMLASAGVVAVETDVVVEAGDDVMLVVEIASLDVVVRK